MGSFPAGLAIHVAAVANGGDLDCLRLVVNQVQHAVVANPNAIPVVPLQLLDARRTRVVLQCKDFGGDARPKSFGKQIGASGNSQTVVGRLCESTVARLSTLG